MIIVRSGKERYEVEALCDEIAVREAKIENANRDISIRKAIEKIMTPIGKEGGSSDM